MRNIKLIVKLKLLYTLMETNIIMLNSNSYVVIKLLVYISKPVKNERECFELFDV